MRMIHLLLASTILTRKPMGFDGAAIKLTYDTETDIPTGFAALYTEVDGKWNLTGVEGIKTQKDVNNVSEALRKERNDHKALREKIRKAFGDRNIDEALTEATESGARIEELQAQVEANGDPKNKDAIQKLVDARIKSITAPIERERDGLKTKVGELETEVGSFKTDKRTRRIHDTVREAATKAKLLPEALDDALMNAERVFDVTDDDTVVIKDNVGFTPGVDATVWFTEMQTKRPHWWAPSTGGGAGGGSRGGGTKNPWTNDNWNMTEQGKMYRENPTRAAQLAESAGTKIGGIRPQKK